MQVGWEAYGCSVERARVEANKAANMNTYEDASANFAFTRKAFHDDVIQISSNCGRLSHASVLIAVHLLITPRTILNCCS